MDLLLIGATASEICGDDDLKIVLGIVSTILTVIQIVVPILLIIMGSIDLMKAVMAGKEDEIKKAQTTFVKRVIVAIIVFLIPVLVNIIIGLISDVDGHDSWTDCWTYIKNN